MSESSKKVRAEKRAQKPDAGMWTEIPGTRMYADADAPGALYEELHVYADETRRTCVFVERAPAGWAMVELELPESLVERYAVRRTTGDLLSITMDKAMRVLEGNR